MKFIFPLTLLFFLIQPTFSLAQEDSSITKPVNISDTYEHFSKSKTTAVLLECFLPSAGHAYAGNWTRGLPFAIGKLGCVPFMVIDRPSSDKNSGKRNLTTAIAGVSYLAISIWEAIDASNQVDKYNDELRTLLCNTKYGFELFQPGNTIKLYFSWSI